MTEETSFMTPMFNYRIEISISQTLGSALQPLQFSNFYVDSGLHGINELKCSN